MPLGNPGQWTERESDKLPVEFWGLKNTQEKACICHYSIIAASMIFKKKCSLNLRSSAFAVLSFFFLF